jgi:hypothetical protein
MHGRRDLQPAYPFYQEFEETHIDSFKRRCPSPGKIRDEALTRNSISGRNQHRSRITGQGTCLLLFAGTFKVRTSGDTEIPPPLPQQRTIHLVTDLSTWQLLFN